MSAQSTRPAAARADAGTATTAARAGRRLPRTLGVTLTAAAAAVAVWTVAVPLVGVDLDVHSGATATRPVTLASVVVVSVLAGLLGAASHRLVARSPRGVLAWRVLAGAVLLLSLGGAVSGVGAAAVGTLVCLHLVVGLVVIVGQSGRRA